MDSAAAGDEGHGQDYGSRVRVVPGAPRSRPGVHAAIFERSLDAIILVDEGGTIVDANPAACTLTEMTREELLGTPISVFAEHAGDPEAALTKLMETGATKAELTIVLSGGTRKRVAYSATADVLDGVHMGIVRDVTEERATEEALRASEALFARVFHLGPVAMAVSTVPEGRIIDMNETCCRLTGRTRDEVVGKTSAELELWADPAHRTRIAAAFEDSASVRDFRTLMRRGDGEIRAVLLSMESIEAHGKPCVVAVVTDITDAERGEALLRESEEKFRAIFERGSEPKVLALWSDGRILDANAAMLALLGRDKPSSVGRTFQDLGFWADSEERYRVRAELEANGAIEGARARFVRADGAVLTCSIAAQRMQIAGQECFLAVFRDLTDQAAAESARARLEQQLHQAQKMEAVGSLAAGVAHDFNNLLSVVLSYGDLVLSSLERASPAREDVEQIVQAGRRATDLTRQLLAFSRQQILEPRAVNTNERLREMHAMLRRLVSERIRVTLRLDDSVGPVFVDPTQLEQVILNLVVNARDAIPYAGTITIETSRAGLDEGAACALGCAPGQYVVLSVSDNGTGMDPATAGKIFDPFFTTKETGKGTGLGLATVFGVVQQSCGAISVDTAPGAGTTMRIFLPETEPRPIEDHPSRAPTELAGTETILLVEDDAVVRKVVREVLQRNGYFVLDASNPGEAILIFERHAEDIDLLLTDVVMPHMGGRALAERLRAQRPSLPVVFMSGYTDDEVIREGALGAGTAFLQKPLTPASLLRKVREVLEAAPLCAVGVA